MSIELVTGYAGAPHVSAADHGALNADIFGRGKYGMIGGSSLEHEIINNNTVRIKDGDIVLNGRFIRLTAFEDVTIENGRTGYNRNDLICMRYSIDLGTAVESANLIVLKGEAVEGEAVDPAFEDGDVLNGDPVVDMPLYRVRLEGLNIASVDKLFKDGAKLEADNGIPFHFGYDEANNQYGYYVDGELRPFSNARALYDALQYSGLVTPDMSYNEMLEALREAFPPIFDVSMVGRGNVSNVRTSGFSAISEVYTKNQPLYLRGISNLTVNIPSVTGQNCDTDPAEVHLQGSNDNSTWTSLRTWTSKPNKTTTQINMLNNVSVSDLTFNEPYKYYRVAALGGSHQGSGSKYYATVVFNLASCKLSVSANPPT